MQAERDTAGHVYVCVFMLMCMCPCVLTFVGRIEGGFMDVLLILPWSCCKPLTVISLQVYVFPTRIASVVFCTKEAFSTQTSSGC